ncbi:MAG: hypothetical protein S0880_27430 [Actinomycetota bacterium]|nr:hypothetical protein [Actinomycetota bacterium]
MSRRNDDRLDVAHAAAQRVWMSLMTAVSRAQAPRRTTGLPPHGTATYFSTVVRLPPELVPDLDIEAPDHRYRPEDVHVTVANLNDATVPMADALETLRGRELPAVRFRIEGLGRSPGTLFLRCVHDHTLRRLRTEIRDAFGAPPPPWPERAFAWLSFANVARFDGPGTWPGRGDVRADVTVDELELVTTDRFFSPEATTVLARLALGRDHT